MLDKDTEREDIARCWGDILRTDHSFRCTGGCTRGTGPREGHSPLFPTVVLRHAIPSSGEVAECTWVVDHLGTNSAISLGVSTLGESEPIPLCEDWAGQGKRDRVWFVILRHDGGSFLSGMHVLRSSSSLAVHDGTTVRLRWRPQVMEVLLDDKCVGAIQTPLQHGKHAGNGLRFAVQFWSNYDQITLSKPWLGVQASESRHAASDSDKTPSAARVSNDSTSSTLMPSEATSAARTQPAFESFSWKCCFECKCVKSAAWNRWNPSMEAFNTPLPPEGCCPWRADSGANELRFTCQDCAATAILLREGAALAQKRMSIRKAAISEWPRGGGSPGEGGGEGRGTTPADMPCLPSFVKASDLTPAILLLPQQLPPPSRGNTCSNPPPPFIQPRPSSVHANMARWQGTRAASTKATSPRPNPRIPHPPNLGQAGHSHRTSARSEHPAARGMRWRGGGSGGVLRALRARGGGVRWSGEGGHGLDADARGGGGGFTIGGHGEGVRGRERPKSVEYLGVRYEVPTEVSWV